MNERERAGDYLYTGTILFLGISFKTQINYRSFRNFLSDFFFRFFKWNFQIMIKRNQRMRTKIARLSLLIIIVFRCVLASLYEGVQEGTGSEGERDYSLELCVRRHYVSDGKIDTFLYNYTCFCLLDTERDKNMFRL